MTLTITENLEDQFVKQMISECHDDYIKNIEDNKISLLHKLNTYTTFHANAKGRNQEKKLKTPTFTPRPTRRM